MSNIHFSYHDKDMGCGTIFLLGLVILAVIFGAPWIVQIAWGMIAVGMFGAPALSYWAAFMGTWALHIIFRANVSSGNKS